MNRSLNGNAFETQLFKRDVYNTLKDLVSEDLFSKGV